MNGEMAPGDEEGKEKEGPAAAAPGPSLTKSQMFEGVATVHDSPVQVKQGSNSIEINIKKPNSAPQELTVRSAIAPWDNSVMQLVSRISRSSHCLFPSPWVYTLALAP
jgi:hypothetical protein